MFHFDLFILIVLSAENNSIFIGSSASVIGAPIGIASASFSFAFSLFKEIIKELLKTARNKKKKHNKIVMLARSKLSSIESEISEALINSEINHEDFTTINNEKNFKNYKRIIFISRK